RRSVHPWVVTRLHTESGMRPHRWCGDRAASRERASDPTVLGTWEFWGARAVVQPGRFDPDRPGGHEASFASGCVVAGAVSVPGPALWGRAWPGAGAAACVFTGRRPSLTVDISEVASRDRRHGSCLARASGRQASAAPARCVPQAGGGAVARFFTPR